MMTDKTKRLIIECMAYGVTLMLTLGLAVGVQILRCHWQWEASGMASKWRPFAGCLIEVTSGRWMPDEVVRELGISTTEKEGRDGRL